MSETSDPRKPTWRSRIRRLARSVANGTYYARWKDVVKQIRRVRRLPPTEWIVLAKDLYSETLVFLIKQTHRAEKEVVGALLQELIRRTVRLARRWVRWLDSLAAEEIVLKVEIRILELVLTEKPSRDSDFLEVSFATAVKRRTLDAIDRHFHSPLGHRGEILAGPADEEGDDFEEIERPIELVADRRPGPEAIFLQKEDEELRQKVIQTAYAVVKSKLDLKLVVLHIGYDWPISSKDPEVRTLARRFNKSPRQIQYRIDKALKAIRAALGVDAEGMEYQTSGRSGGGLQ
jgi:hypothetical protein